MGCTWCNIITNLLYFSAYGVKRVTSRDWNALFDVCYAFILFLQLQTGDTKDIG